jgi:hypothetical protein
MHNASFGPDSAVARASQRMAAGANSAVSPLEGTLLCTDLAPRMQMIGYEIKVPNRSCGMAGVAQRQ